MEITAVIQAVLRTLNTIATSLWLGGIMWLMAGVQILFATNRDVAVQAAPILFLAFERYQMTLAPIAFITALLLWRSARNRIAFAVAIVCTFSLILALVSALIITPRVDALRVAGEGGSQQFKTLHGYSMLCLSAEAMLLLASLIGVAWLRPGKK